MVPRVHWLSADGPPGSPGAIVHTSKRTAPGIWSAKTVAYSTVADPPIVPAGFDPNTQGIEAFSAGVEPGPGDDPGIILYLDDQSNFGLSQYSLENSTTAPVQIDPTQSNWVTGEVMMSRDYFTVAQGAFYFNAAWWSVQNVDQLKTPTRLRVYKSLDRITWTAQDVANEPLPWFGTNSAAWDGDYHSDSKIHAIYCPAVGSLTWSLVEFDMLTGLWSAPHDPVNLAFNVFKTRVHQINYSALTGDVFILYHNGKFGFPPNVDLGVKYGFLSGGVWTVGVFIDSRQPAGASSSQALLDPNGTTLHYIFIASSFGGPETPGRYVRIDLGGAVSNSANFMLSNGAGFGAGYAYFCGHSLIDGNSILIPYAEPIDPAVGTARRPSVFVGTPLAAPVWTSENIDPDPMVVAPGLFMGFGAAPPPPVVNPVILTQGSRRLHILIPNRFDTCLEEQAWLYKVANPTRFCCTRNKYTVPFRKISAIPTPLAISGDVDVLDFQVPMGYDGLISGLFHLYNGPGFNEASGDIEWRLLINRTYALHLGQILVSLGSERQSYPLDGGLPIQSGQRIRYIVSAPNLSGGILPLNSQIVCGLEGLFYARQ